jgi:hypothetical protein
MARERLSYRSLKAPVWVLSIVTIPWAAILTAVLVDDPHEFYCGGVPCSVIGIVRLFAVSAFLVFWLVAPYVTAGCLLYRFAPQLNRALPRRLRWHPRGASAVRMILGILIGIGHVGLAVGTYAMLHFNPHDDFCRSAASLAEANFFSSNGPCYISLGELTLLFARNVVVFSVFLAPIAAIGWLLTLMALYLERAGQRWLGRRPFN